MGILYEPINGNVVIKDSDLGLAHRWYDAWGADVVKLVEDFVNTPFSAADQMAGWLATLVEAGTESTVALVAGSAGGEALFTTAGNDNDGVNAQLMGEAFTLVSRYPTYIGTRFRISEATETEVGIGLCITDDSVLTAVSDGLYFRTLEASTVLNLVARKDSIETVIGVATLVAATNITAELLYLDGVARIYINGIEVAQLADSDPNWPDDEYLTPTIAILAGDANIKTMNVDWLRIIQIQAV